MLKKRSKHIISVIVVLFLGYNSVHIQSYQDVQAAVTEEGFNAQSFAGTFWTEKIMPSTERAVEIDKLYSLLQTEKEQTFEKHSNALGIGNLRYFLIQGQGEIIDLNEDVATLLIKNTDDAEAIQVEIALEYVYGNAVRDALGVLALEDFNNTMDLNKVSEEINKKIRSEITTPFRSQAKKGDIVAFTGAIELNKEYLNLKNVEVIPIVLKIVEK